MDNERKKIVTKIPADESKTSRVAYGKKIKVAAYCRVSTDSEDQMNSYRAQMEYYTKHISENPDWEFVDVYADEGITGTLVKKRENFLRMIRDCEKGKIDMILTKSVSRFARNIVDKVMFFSKKEPEEMDADYSAVFFSEPGDKFYLLMSSFQKKQNIIKAFNAKYYKLTEEDFDYIDGKYYPRKVIT